MRVSFSVVMLLLVGCQPTEVGQPTAFQVEQAKWAAVRERETKPQMGAQRKAAISRFEFNGIALGMTLVEFHRQYPDAEPEKAGWDAKTGMETYSVRDRKPAYRILFVFVDRRLYRTAITYSDKWLKNTNLDLLYDKLVDRFGQPVSGQGFDLLNEPYCWFDGDTVIVAGDAEGSGFRIIFYSNSVLKKIEAREKAEINLGF